MRPVAALLLLCGCAPLDPDTGRPAPSYEDPVIVEATAVCDVAEARWTFEVATQGWTGNGQVLLSADGSYVEKHTMYSVGAAADETSDALALSLAVVRDFRNVVAGTSTAFNCDAAGLAGVIRVYDRTGDAVADCRAFGSAPERWAEWDASAACEVVLPAAE